MNSMYLVSVFPLSSLALRTWDIVNENHLKRNAPPLSRTINKTACTGSICGFFIYSLMTGNMWGYIANKPLYLFAPTFKMPCSSLSKLHLSTKVQTIFQTTSHCIMQCDQICCPGEACKFLESRAVSVLKESTHINYFSLLTDIQIFFPKIYVNWLQKTTMKLHLTTEVLLTQRV